MSFGPGALEHEGISEDFKFRRIGKTNFFEYYLKDIAMTGSDVVKRLAIRFPHRILNIMLFHGDSNKDANSDTLQFRLEVPKNSWRGFPDVEDYIFKSTTITVARKRIAFNENEGGVFSSRLYKLTLNTTNGHYVTPIIVVQRLGRLRQ